MILPKLALRNLFGAGIRTWLNVLALSLAFVAIIFTQGIYNGMNDQARHALVEALYGGGQYWHPRYDPYDPLTLPDAHGPVPAALDSLVRLKQATAILVRQGTIYPRGRFRSVLLRGIDPEQDVLAIPSGLLKGGGGGDELPALIGTRMAASTGLAPGDRVTIEWRDAHGTFDAADAVIVQVLRTPVAEIDNAQLWVPLAALGRLTDTPGEASFLVLKAGTPPVRAAGGWTFRDSGYLLRDLRSLIRSKSISGSILYAFLLLLAMLAIFDTQVLSIFRRRKEIGTLMALGMTRSRVIGLFTLEGMLHAVLAATVAAVYGIPLLSYAAEKGYGLPEGTEQFGLAIGERIFPVYSATLVGGTTLLVFLVTTVVSFMPTRRIARLKPTDALRGRMA